MQYFVGFVSPGKAKANNGCGGKLDSYLIASCVENIDVKNYKNMVVFLQVTIENVRDAFSGHGVYCNFVTIVGLANDERCMFDSQAASSEILRKCFQMKEHAWGDL